jgi:hypothetical protein
MATSEPTALRHAIKPLRELYGLTFATDFGPLAFKTLREKMVALKWSRKTVNIHCLPVKGIFRWGVENELLPADRWEPAGFRRVVRGEVPPGRPRADALTRRRASLRLGQRCRPTSGRRRSSAASMSSSGTAT